MSWTPVYRLIKKIPRGRVTTYGELARALRLPGGARAVGYAMAATPKGQGIPWQRVIGAGGKIRMPEPHASLQRRLLESEGVAMNGNSLDMSLYGWSPLKKAGRRTAAAGRGKRKRAGRPVKKR
jgi:methylated-DNA-protein-cysteine methyltransferase-like protein